MKFFNKIEDIEPRLYEECVNKGKVERIDYKTIKFDGSPMDKYAFVYTPYNYDPAQKYEILYLIHGGGESAEKYLFQNGEENPLKRAVDNLIQDGTIRPVIIVTPSPYPDNNKEQPRETMSDFCRYFANELADDLIPAVEAKYHSYSDFKTSPEDLKAIRAHRKVMGWSMGSMTTWFVFVQKLAYFSSFGFLSGGSRVVEGEANRDWADATAKFIVNAVKEQGFEKKDFEAYAITGTLDITYVGFTLQMGALMAYPEVFDFYSKEQNTTYVMWPEGEHHTQWRLQYTINAIKQFYNK